MCSIVNARTITEGEAIQKALEFLHVEDRSAEIERFFISGKAEMYKVTTTNGWVLLSSETSVKPVLAYSRTDDFPNDEDMPESMRWLFSYYEDAIYYAKLHEQEVSHINAWSEANEYDIQRSLTDTVYLSRMDSVFWGQYWNNSHTTSCDITYNKFCPDFYPIWCGKTRVGCGAVALGQVLWYYQWPHAAYIPKQMLNENGNVSSDKEYRFYDWSYMPGAISPDTSISKIDEIAALLRDCGYIEKMQYGSGGSFANLNDVVNALKYTFGYPNTYSVSRGLLPAGWVSRMKYEILHNRPVIYLATGSNGKGHFFILHGFEGDLFDINWGQLGNSNNIKCTLNALQYESVIDTVYFNSYANHYAIINIQPAYPSSCSPITIPSTDVWNTNFLITNGGGIEIANRTISGGSKGGIISGDYVRMDAGFKVNSGASVYIAVRDMHCNSNRGEEHPSEHSNAVEPQRSKKQVPSYDNTAVRKILRDGQIYIIRGDKTYTLTGIETK